MILDSWKDITAASMTILDPANGEPLLKAEASHIRFFGRLLVRAQPETQIFVGWHVM